VNTTLAGGSRKRRGIGARSCNQARQVATAEIASPMPAPRDQRQPQVVMVRAQASVSGQQIGRVFITFRRRGSSTSRPARRTPPEHTARSPLPSSYTAITDRDGEDSAASRPGVDSPGTEQRTDGRMSSRTNGVQQTEAPTQPSASTSPGPPPLS